MIVNVPNTYIIAEIGINHNGDINLAKKMILEAKDFGANAVKFQSYNTERLVSQGTPKVEYQKNNTKKNESHFEMLKKCELSDEDHLQLYNYANTLGIDFISTPYDQKAAEYLKKIGVCIFKTASADIVDFPLHKYLSSLNKEVIISTGMATETEVLDVLSIYKKKNTKLPYLLHCISNYPCSDESINLKVINFLKSINGDKIGFSDHSIGNYASIGAIVLGAKIIEKHFTIDKNMNGPDHKASSNIEEFKSLIYDIRKIEKILGSEEKKIYEEEEQMRLVSRKSIFLTNNIKASHQIKFEDLTLQRPGTGIFSKHLDDIIGKRAKTDLLAGEMLSFDKIY